ncbi:MAG: preprotein translocase subunit SecA, partial [Nannocystaceae bacterium]
LDDAARKEQRNNLPPPPEFSGPHTVESMSKDVHTRVLKIIDNHCRSRMEDAGENAGVDNPFPAAGIDHHALTHDLYRHFGAMVPLLDVAQNRKKIIDQSLDVVARSLIQQRERVHELAFKKVDEMVDELCPADVHPDEWDLPGLEAMTRERFGATVDLANVDDNLEKLVERVWVAVEALITKREGQFGLYTFLFYVRQFYLAEIDEQWIAHLKNIENLRTGIGLVGYATRNPKNEYKIRGFNLFRDMWESIEHTVLDKILSMRLTAEQQQKAEEGAEYETSVTRGNAGRRARNRGQGSRQSLNQDQAAKVQQAARQMMQSMQQMSEAVADANPEDMIAKAAAKAASKSLKADDGSGRTGRRRRRKKASS